MFNQMGMITDLIRNAGKLRETAEKAAETLGQLVVEGQAGGGAVTVKVNGRLEVISVRLDPSLWAEQDRELVEDLIVAAIAQAQTRARESAAQSLQALAGPLGPGLFPGFGGGASSPGS